MYSLAELHRLKGELILKSDEQPNSGRRAKHKVQGVQEISRTVAEARICFANAIEIAKQQNAQGWEMRALSSMERLASLV
jgi:hypothetical protein